MEDAPRDPAPPPPEKKGKDAGDGGGEEELGYALDVADEDLPIAVRDLRLPVPEEWAARARRLDPVWIWRGGGVLLGGWLLGWGGALGVALAGAGILGLRAWWARPAGPEPELQGGPPRTTCIECGARYVYGLVPGLAGRLEVTHRGCQSCGRSVCPACSKVRAEVEPETRTQAARRVVYKTCPRCVDEEARWEVGGEG